MSVDLSFLDNGEYTMTVFKDGVNANTEATDYKREISKVKAGDQLKIHLAQGGGWAARIEKL